MRTKLSVDHGIQYFGVEPFAMQFHLGHMEASANRAK